jgi:hypothetical protein
LGTNEKESNRHARFDSPMAQMAPNGTMSH